MTNQLLIYNTLSRKKERFEPINPPFVGLYACGPTVYGDAHLGHARQAITFDVLFRTLLHLEYRVRYVRNITDVGHLVDDADDGEDKILKKARLESLEQSRALIDPAIGSITSIARATTTVEDLTACGSFVARSTIRG